MAHKKTTGIASCGSQAHHLISFQRLSSNRKIVRIVILAAYPDPGLLDASIRQSPASAGPIV
jgi:hypothetical protein